MEIEQAAMDLPESADAVVDRIGALGLRVADISREIHQLSHSLHSTKLETLGLVAAVRGHCQELNAQGMEIAFEDSGLEPGIPDEVALCLFRIAQEAIANVGKHSGVRSARVTLEASSGEVALTVADGGQGFDPEEGAKKGRLGLVSMRERLRLVHGHLTIRSKPGDGTVIEARVPVVGVRAPEPSVIVRA
jgi:signal transduction histidine kinase